MSATEALPGDVPVSETTSARPLAHWPADALLALVLDDAGHDIEVVLTRDGALLDGRPVAVRQHVRVAEQRAGRRGWVAGVI